MIYAFCKEYPFTVDYFELRLAVEIDDEIEVVTDNLPVIAMAVNSLLSVETKQVELEKELLTEEKFYLKFIQFVELAES